MAVENIKESAFPSEVFHHQGLFYAKSLVNGGCGHSHYGNHQARDEAYQSQVQLHGLELERPVGFRPNQERPLLRDSVGLGQKYLIHLAILEFKWTQIQLVLSAGKMLVIAENTRQKEDKQGCCNQAEEYAESILPWQILVHTLRRWSHTEEKLGQQSIYSHTNERCDDPNVSLVQVVDLNHRQHKDVAQHKDEPHLPLELVLDESSVQLYNGQGDPDKRKDKRDSRLVSHSNSRERIGAHCWNSKLAEDRGQTQVDAHAVPVIVEPHHRYLRVFAQHSTHLRRFSKNDSCRRKDNYCAVKVARNDKS
jgi:hypothetical protein